MLEMDKGHGNYENWVDYEKVPNMPILSKLSN